MLKKLTTGGAAVHIIFLLIHFEIVSISMSVISFEILFCLLLEGQLATKSLKNWAEGQLATFGFFIGYMGRKLQGPL